MNVACILARVCKYPGQFIFTACVLGFAYLPACAVAHDKQASQVFIRGGAFALSEPVPVYDFLHNFKRPLRSDYNAFAYTWAEAGIQGNGYAFSILRRDDYEVKANRDAARFYQLSKNDRPLTPGEVFNAQLKYHHVSYDGLRAALVLNQQKTRLEIGVSYLVGRKLTQGTLAGTATAVDPDDFSFTANVDYFYDKDYLFDRRVSPPDGDGFSLDFDFQTLLFYNFDLRIKVTDLVGYINWDKAPYTHAVARSDNQSFDDDGNIQFNPVLQGIEGNRDFRQRLKPRGYIQLYTPMRPQGRVGLRYWRNNVADLVFMSWQLKWSGYTFTTELVPKYIGVGVSVERSWFSLSLLSDNLDYKRAHLLRMQASIRYLF